MSVGLRPYSLFPEHVQIDRRAKLALFKFTPVAQKRLEDLLTRKKDLGLTSDEQAALDALAELDRIFTYVNAELYQKRSSNVE
jgi:hypothetical protein